ncbi:MAG TPA: DsbA family protein, partial [Gammaproteobacteria bacterium]|nr:DsbA family protein [Gammaproteobacteria bacterium]
MKPTLYYIHDPMCSWCWGFRPVWHQVQKNVKDRVTIRPLLGGLAPDDEQPMSESMQKNIQDNWKRIQQTIPGTKFNDDFWEVCTPRRSTYPACRAVIAAGLQDGQFAEKMLLAIQQAYYLYARNPSDDPVLIQLAKEIGLDGRQFKIDLSSERCKLLLKEELQQVANLGVS